MPEKKTRQRVARDRRAGRSASTQAGEFVREELEHVREGKHGARSTKQAIAIGLSKARRSGVKLPPPKAGRTSPEVRERARRDLAKGKRRHKPSRRRSRATRRALEREGRSAAAKKNVARQARAAAARRTPAERSGAARKAARTRSSRK